MERGKGEREIKHVGAGRAGPGRTVVVVVVRKRGEGWGRRCDYFIDCSISKNSGAGYCWSLRDEEGDSAFVQARMEDFDAFLMLFLSHI